MSRGANVNAQDSSSIECRRNGDRKRSRRCRAFFLQNGWKEAPISSRLRVQSENAALVKTALASKVTRQGLQSALGGAERMKRVTHPDPESCTRSPPAERLPAYWWTRRRSGAMQEPTAPAPRDDPDSYCPGRDADRTGTSPTGFLDARRRECFACRNSVRHDVHRASGTAQSIKSGTGSDDRPRADHARGSGDLTSRLHRYWVFFTWLHRNLPVPHRAVGLVPRRRRPETVMASARSLNGTSQAAATSSGRCRYPGRQFSLITWATCLRDNAISKAGDNSFLTGTVWRRKAGGHLSEHEWKIYASTRPLERLLWERAAFSGAPKKRHTKGSQANSTPVDRRPARRGRVRVGRPAGRVGHEGQRALARRSEFWTADGSSIRPINGATPAHPSFTANGDSPGGYPERVLSCRLGFGAVNSSGKRRAPMRSPRGALPRPCPHSRRT